MPNILFASNSVSHFPGSIISSLSWSFDSKRVPYSIRTPRLTICSSPIFKASTTDETWFHFRAGMDDLYVNNDEPIAEIVDYEGNRIFQLTYHNKTSEGYHCRASIDGQSFTNVRYLPNIKNQMRTYDIQLKMTGVQAEIRVYVNEILIEEMTFAIANHEKPRFLWLGGADGDFSGDFGNCFYSEIIVADGDTRNARLDLLRPTAAGVYEDWNGPLASLSDDDPTTGMTTTMAEQFQSTILTPYTGADNISNIVQVTTSVRGINSPENLQHLIRMSGVDYLTPNFAIPYNKDYQVTDWTLNPATSLPWQADDLTSAEFGFKSVA
jgi:hypothetical protein